MFKPECLKAKPADNYEDLKSQFFALKKLCESKINQCSVYSKRLAEYDRDTLIASNEGLESEREMNAQLTAELEKAEAERDEMVQEAYYQGLKAGLFVTPPQRPKGENSTACAINYFEHTLDRHCRGLSVNYLEQLRKELEK